MYQTLIEQCFTSGAQGMDYQPGRTQTYRICFVRYLQIRTSRAEGWGLERRIRRTFVPIDVEKRQRPAPSDTQMAD